MVAARRIDAILAVDLVSKTYHACVQLPARSIQSVAAGKPCRGLDPWSRHRPRDAWQKDGADMTLDDIILKTLEDGACYRQRGSQALRRARACQTG
jgi:hypothetical protein